MEYDRKQFKGYSVITPGFEGPMDLLLFLVKNYEINIYDIPILLIIEQFQRYINMMKKVNLDIASEFIVMVAHLLLIKTKMLLPADADLGDDEEDPRSELVEQLLEYQKFKVAAAILEEKEIIGHEILEKKPGQMVFEFGDDDNWVDLKVFDLVNAFSRIISDNDEEKPVFPVFDEDDDDYDPDEKIDEIHSYLKLHGKAGFADVIKSIANKAEIIITFLAVLHMIKQGLIVVRQHKMFGDINMFLIEEKEVGGFDE